MQTDAAAPRAHWLFKREGDAVSCVGIVEVEGGHYWVVDSPTGTYLSGHADRGKWKLVQEEFIAAGYVPESQARQQGLIAATWSRSVPTLTGERRGRKAAVGILLAIAILLLYLLAA